MFALWPYIYNFFSKGGVFLLGVASLLLFRKNKQLTLKNEEMKQEQDTADKTIEIQNKVIDVTQNTRPTDLNGTLERLRNNKL